MTFWVFSSNSIVTLKAARPHEHEGKERLPKDQRERWTIFDFTIFTCKLNLTFEIVEEFGSCKIHLDRVSTSHHPVFKIKTCNSSLFALTCQCMYFWPHPSLWRGSDVMSCGKTASWDSMQDQDQMLFVCTVTRLLFKSYFWMLASHDDICWRFSWILKLEVIVACGGRFSFFEGSFEPCHLLNISVTI